MPDSKLESSRNVVSYSTLHPDRDPHFDMTQNSRYKSFMARGINPYEEAEAAALYADRDYARLKSESR